MASLLHVIGARGASGADGVLMVGGVKSDLWQKGHQPSAMGRGREKTWAGGYKKESDLSQHDYGHSPKVKG